MICDQAFTPAGYRRLAANFHCRSLAILARSAVLFGAKSCDSTLYCWVARQCKTNTYRQTNIHRTNPFRNVVAFSVVDETSCLRRQVVVGPLRWPPMTYIKTDGIKGPACSGSTSKTSSSFDSRNNSTGNSRPLLARSHGNLIQHDADNTIVKECSIHCVSNRTKSI